MESTERFESLDSDRIVNPGYHPNVLRNKVEKLLAVIDSGAAKTGPWLTYRQINVYLRLNLDPSRAWLDTADNAQHFGQLNFTGECYVKPDGSLFHWNGTAT